MVDMIIYHNPDCGTSRNTLGLIRNAGIEPHVIEYLKSPPTRAMLKSLIARMDVPVRSIVRVKGTPYHELGGATLLPTRCACLPTGSTFLLAYRLKALISSACNGALMQLERQPRSRVRLPLSHPQPDDGNRPSAIAAHSH
jgi:hypothetical protein